MGRRGRARAATVALFAVGVGIRVAFMARDRPGFVGYPDARTFIIAAERSLFSNPCRPAGYPLFLRAMRRLDGRLSATTAAQHALGVATAGALYAATGSFVRRPEVCLLPAGVVLLGGAQLFLEHSVMSEGPYTALLAGALYCASRATRGTGTGRESAWLAGSGAALGVSATLRSSGALSVVPMIGWAASRPEARARERLGAAAAVASAAAVPLGAYLVAHHAATGSWSLIRAQGFTLYGRMAPLADPGRFTPPPGTEQLCETTDPRRRPNATWYMFAWPDSPALACFGPPPYPRDGAERGGYAWPADRLLGAFALAALRGQPRDYLGSVVWALANYVRPHSGPESAIGWDHDKLIGELHNHEFEAAALDDLTSYYETGRGYLSRHRGMLDRYARATSLEGIATAALAALAVAGWVGRAGSARRGASLFGGTALAMAVLLAGSLFYDARYATPMYGPLAAAAAIGIDRALELRGALGA